MSEIDHRARASTFHRRAQRAEARAQEALADVDYWRDRACFWIETAKARAASRRNLKRKLTRVRKDLADLRLQHQDPLRRIITLGRLFP